MGQLICLMLAGMLTFAGTAGAAQSQSPLSQGDYTEIQMLYARYAHAYDSSNPDMWTSTFTEDSQFVIGERVLRGRKEIATLIGSRGPVKSRPKIFHLNSNILIEPSPEGAKGSAYVVLIDLQKNPAITGGGTYEDVIVKTGEGWRFKKRTFFPEAQATPAPAK